MDEIIKNRKFVSELIFQVLTERKTVREALSQYPSFECESDRSLEAAWHAIVHFEADEDIRAKDIEYAEAQNEYLEFIAFTLQKGNELPQNIIDEYRDYYGETLVSKKEHKPKDWWEMLLKPLNIKKNGKLKMEDGKLF